MRIPLALVLSLLACSASSDEAPATGHGMLSGASVMLDGALSEGLAFAARAATEASPRSPNNAIVADPRRVITPVIHE